MANNFCVRGVVYFVIVVNIIGGMLNLARGVNDDADNGVIIGALLMLLNGVLLLIGVIKNDAYCVLAYLIICGVSWIIVIIAICSATSTSYKPRLLTDGDVTVIVLMLVIECVMQFCVYLFYKDLVAKSKPQRVQPALVVTEDTLVTLYPEVPDLENVQKAGAVV